MTALVLATPRMIDWVWSAASRHLARLVKRGATDLDLPAIRQRLLAGDMQLWLAEDLAVALTEMRNDVDGRTLRIRGMAGRLYPGWRDHLAEIYGWARGQGCGAVEIPGRRAWHRLLPDYGIQSVVYRRAL